MDFQPIAEYMNSLVEKGVPGCDVMVMRSHETLFRYSCGARSAGGSEPVKPTDMYRMYSCTKPVTVAAAMQLVEQGRLGLDEPVSRYLPEYGQLQVRRGDGLVPAQRVMRVRHLFTMSGGLDYDLGAEPVQRLFEETRGQATTRLVAAALAQKPLLFEPGTRFEYSLCHDVLAAVIEVVSGERFGEYLQNHIFLPLGMTEATLHATEKLLPRIPALYRYDSETRQLLTAEFGFDFPQYESGGAALLSTLSDYALFADAMACGGVGRTGARILRPETVELLRTEQLTALVEDPAFGCAAGPGYGYGLGVRTRIDRKEGQRSPLGEFGWDGAAGAYIMMDQEHGLSIVYAQHVLNWPAMLGCVHAPIRDLAYEALERV